MEGDPLKRANLALIVELVVQGTLDSRIHGSDLLDGVPGLSGHAAGRRTGDGFPTIRWIDDAVRGYVSCVVVTDGGHGRGSGCGC